MDIFTLVIASIGCVTGITGLVIKLFEYIRSRPKLKIELDDLHYSFFFNSSDIESTSFSSKYYAIVSLKISNCSVHPVSISSISASVSSSVPVKHLNFFNFRLKKIVGKTGLIQVPYSSGIKLPRRLESYDVVLESARFPFFEPIINETGDSIPINMQISVITPNKSFQQEISLIDYKHLANRLLLQES